MTDPATFKLTMVMLLCWTACNSLMLLYLVLWIFRLKRGMNTSFKKIGQHIGTLDGRTRT